MVALDKIYTRAGDDGTTRLATGEPVAKHGPRVEAIGAVDEANVAVGAARLHAAGQMDAILARIQNELFDLGADLATPERDAPLRFTPLRIVASQVAQLETDIDALNADLAPLTSFVLPAGSALCVALHGARVAARRAERAVSALAAAQDEKVSPEAKAYINRLSDFFFVAARHANKEAGGDVLWVPGASRSSDPQ